MHHCSNLMLAGLLVVALGCVSPAAGPSPAEDGPERTDAERELDLASFDYVWRTIRDTHWDPELGGVDWQAASDELRPEVERATTHGEVVAVLEDLIGRLGQSHFGILPTEVYEDLEKPEGGAGDDSAGWGNGVTGLEVRVIDGRAVVVSVREGSPAAAAGVRPGWIVEAVGERQLQPLISRHLERCEAELGCEIMLSVVLARRLGGEVGEPLELHLLTGEDEHVVRQVELAEAHGKRVRLGYLPPMWVWLESRLLEDEVGYIAFNSFADPATVMDGFGSAVQSFASARGIVIDLRGNPGGIGGMAMGMAGWFVDRPGLQLGTMTTRDGSINFAVFPRPETFSGPLAVLVDGLSASTSEIMAGGLQDLGRARVFGSTSAGMALPSRIEKLPNGDGFQYAIANYVGAGGQPLEGRGVIPDVEVRPTRDGLLQGHDEVLDAAVAWIQSQDRAVDSAATTTAG
jgi:carboxyl-terminal processing protease